MKGLFSRAHFVGSQSLWAIGFSLWLIAHASTASAASYSIGGTVTGLASGKSVTLKNNGTNSTVITNPTASFTFSTKIASGSAYAVSVSTQPSGQTCAVSNGSGTVASSNVTNVTINCTTNTYSIGGTVTGLAYGKSVTLKNNGTNSTVITNPTASFTFSTKIASGSAYAVSVSTQPSGQTCSVSNASGNVASANVTNVTISCTTNTYSIGGTVTGLSSGQSVTLQNNLTNSTAITNPTTGFTFSTKIAYGSPYAVTVSTQPTGQTCAVTNGSGTTAANVTNVAVTCANQSAPITVSPRNAALTLTQTQQFSALINGSGPAASWSASGGTVDNNGLYTPPATPGVYTVTATSGANTANATVAVTDLSGVYTWHNDAARTGLNLQEYALTPSTIVGGNFGKRWSCAVDGEVYAQPLYVAGLVIGGGTHNVVLIATEHDSVYAFDADNGSCTPYWKTSFLSTNVTTMPAADTNSQDILVEVGITGTPVIDRAQNVLYVVGKTREGASPYTYVQRLHALDLATGTDKVPAAILGGSVTGTNGTVTFVSQIHLQRPGLALSPQGDVYVGFASHGDYGAYHGWVMKYTGVGSATPLVQSAIFNSTPSGSQGGIWMSGAAPALDASGYLYFSTGNGTFNDSANTLPGPATDDFSMSFLKLDPTSMGITDFYTPSKWSGWSNSDFDISSAGVMVLPDSTGPTAHPNTLVGGDKQGHLYLIDRTTSSGDTMGVLNSPDKVLQLLALPGVTAGSVSVFSSPAYYQGTVYFGRRAGPVMAFPLTAGLFGVSANKYTYSGLTINYASSSYATADTYQYPSPTPAISASPGGNGLVWVLDNNANGTGSYGASVGLGPAILRAYNATTLGTALYSSATLSADTAGNAIKFVSPVIANGHVYVAGKAQLTVYGLKP